MKNLDFDNITIQAQQKHDLMQEFLELSEQQAKMINQDNYEMVLDIISVKQEIIEKVNLLDFEFPKHLLEQNEWLRNLNKKTIELMSKAALLDEKSIQLSKHNQDQVFEKIINIQKSKKTHAQYRGDNMKMEGMLLDIKK